jgi:hypothetical protein
MPEISTPPTAGDSASSRFSDALHRYASSDIFCTPERPWVADNPFRRPLLNELGIGDLPLSDLGLDNLSCNSGLVANRVLMSVYERDFVFLPRQSSESKWSDFHAYYDSDSRLTGETLRPTLERILFKGIQDSVVVSGPWTVDAFTKYFDDFRSSYTAASNAALMATITGARNPRAAALMYFIQLAGDFLVESSAMTRNVLGNYGALQSELFKVVIDECGYGVHATKHSTMFQALLASHGIDTTPHVYWQFYLPTSLLLNNYYNLICRDHRFLFRYFGAILQVETAFRLTCKQMAHMAREVFGAQTEVDYFLEHVHIDDHHSRMVLDNLVIPAAREHGAFALSEMLRGFEESLVVGELFGNGLKTQLLWADQAPTEVATADQTAEQLMATPGSVWHGTSVADAATRIVAKEGNVFVVAGYRSSFALSKGESLLIPAGCLYGIITMPGAAFDRRATGAPA